MRTIKAIWSEYLYDHMVTLGPVPRTWLTEKDEWKIVGKHQEDTNKVTESSWSVRV